MKKQKMDVEDLYIYIHTIINTPLWVPGKRLDAVRCHVMPYADLVFYRNTCPVSTKASFDTLPSRFSHYGPMVVVCHP